MTDTRAMLDAAHGDPTPERTAAIDALRDCEETCTSCAMAMVETGGMAPEVRRALDCADLCDAAERVLARGPHGDAHVIAAVVEAAAVACEASAAACGAHAEHHDHCRLHSARTAEVELNCRAPWPDGPTVYAECPTRTSSSTPLRTSATRSASWPRLIWMRCPKSSVITTRCSGAAVSSRYSSGQPQSHLPQKVAM